MPLDPIVASMLEQMAAAGAPPLPDMSLPDARAMYREMQAALPKPDLASVEDAEAGAVPLRIYRSSQDACPAIVYFHGGGWVIGDLDTHDSVCRQLALGTGAAVIAVDYRLAPEHPFPAALDDCYAATCWASSHAVELNIDPARLAVAGDSAGGNLATCVCLRIREEGGPRLRHQLLVYPVTDTAMDTASLKENAEGYLLTRDAMVWFFDQYLGKGGKNRDNPYAAPAKAKSLAGLPPACIITAEFDPLRDEGEAYGQALATAGVPVKAQRFDGMIHGFFGMTDMLAGSKAAMALATAEVARAFSSQP